MKNSKLIIHRWTKFQSEYRDIPIVDNEIAVRTLLFLSVSDENVRWESIMEGKVEHSSKLWELNRLETVRIILFVCTVAYPDGQFLERLGPRLIGQKIEPPFTKGAILGSMDALTHVVKNQQLAKKCSEFWEIIFQIAAQYELDLPVSDAGAGSNLSDLAASFIEFFKESGELDDLKRRLIYILSKKEYKTYFTSHRFTPKGNFLAQVVNELSFKSFASMSFIERLRTIS